MRECRRTRVRFPAAPPKGPLISGPFSFGHIRCVKVAVKISGVLCRFVASMRVRQRKDGSSYTSVLYVHQGKQTSSSFKDPAEANRFKDVVDLLGPAHMESGEAV